MNTEKNKRNEFLLSDFAHNNIHTLTSVELDLFKNKIIIVISYRYVSRRKQETAYIHYYNY